MVKAYLRLRDDVNNNVIQHKKKGMKNMSQENLFFSIEYLSQGNQRQREAFEVLSETGIFEILKEYTPILVGTIPIVIDIPESDLDIICEVYDFGKFKDILNHFFREMDVFKYSFESASEEPRLVCNFCYKGWLFEIFGQSKPTVEQNGFKHMIIENRILKIIGSRSNEWIRDLKKSGLKTEPAFGK